MWEKMEHDEVEGPNESQQDRRESPKALGGTRREFIQKATKAGLSAGFAHFLLVGGRVQKAIAATDLCAANPPVPESSTDECLDDDPDLCVYVDYPGGIIRDKVDHCDPDNKQDQDLCKLYLDGDGMLQETIDLCGEAPFHEENDLCSEQIQGGALVEVGDFCPAAGDGPQDRCQAAYLDEVTTAESNDVCPSGLNDDHGGPDKCHVLNGYGYGSTGPDEVGDVCPAGHSSDEAYDMCNRSFATYQDVP